MDDNKKPIMDENKTLDTPPAGDLPPVPPTPTDTPPPPPLSPDEVKVPAQPLPKAMESKETSSIPEVEKVEEPKPPPIPELAEKPVNEVPVTPEIPKPEAPPQPESVSEPMPVPKEELKKEDTSAGSVQEKPIEAPKKEEMPVEAEFPGQPLPKTEQKNLEEKAKEVIEKDGGVKKRKVEVVGKPKGNAKKTLVGMLLFVLLGVGAFAGTKLIGTSTENRSQAGADTNLCYCGPKSDVCSFRAGYVTCGAPGDGKDVNSGLPGCKWSTYDCGGTGEKTVKCCDGNYFKVPEDRKESVVCQGHGGYKDCNEVKPDKCVCDSWANACGVNCRFPEGTGYEGQKKADSTCKTIIAMCDPGTGKVKYEVFNKDHKCWGEVDVCKNPVYEPDCKPDPKKCNESCSADADCDTGLTCDTTSNTCRNPSCTTSENCTCPEGDVICNTLTCSSGDLSLGNSYTFTCNASVTGSKKIETYDFRYKKDAGDWTVLPAASADSNISSELFIGDPGSYVVECRACEEKTNKDKCTPYQITTAD